MRRADGLVRPAKAPVSHGVEPHDLGTSSSLRSRRQSFRTSRRPPPRLPRERFRSGSTLPVRRAITIVCYLRAAAIVCQNPKRPSQAVDYWQTGGLHRAPFVTLAGEPFRRVVPRAQACDEETRLFGGDDRAIQPCPGGGPSNPEGLGTQSHAAGLFQQPVDLPQFVGVRLSTDLCRRHALRNARRRVRLRDPWRPAESQRRQAQLRHP